ncbi:MAG: respiratory-chain NADH dehydrogenase domain-containing [Ignavibacteria bacterium]|nr:MAG: respiratory-chain NADH dehydrogenase domain-containing [Ignavibacteria bacterium]
MNLVQKIFDAGVVGAGGAGFPTHVKAKSSVEFVLANGAECEPLIHKDFELMCNFPDEIVNGVELMTKQTSAKKAYFGIKAKNIDAIDEIEKRIKETKIQMCLLGDFYPSGDEYELVYAATKRLIPPHGLPLDVGCVVNNVETFYNISRAIEDKPVTQKFVSVAGCVKKPSSFFVPIGTSFQELLNHAGGSTVFDYGIFVSGILMGKLTFDLTEVVTKTTSGIIILPKNHYLINRIERPKASMNRIGKSACDQCSYCTEFSLVFSTSGEAVWNQYADLCCSCGLCSLYSCPEDLYPREACDQGKAELKKQGMKYEQQKPVKVHPIKEGRRVPLKQLMKRIDVLKYDNHTPYVKESPKPTQVKILLKQHVGVVAKPVIKLGAIVNEGTLIADIEEGKLGSRIHASISGKVTHVSEEFIRITG